jgi:TetR/AcrR family tetracycline transcriptional repressor
VARSSTQPALSEDAIVTAARKLIGREGAAGLTMRDLASELGVSPMAAYHYVDGKDDLLRRVGNHVWSLLSVPPPEAGPWYLRLRQAIMAEREALAPYPGLDAALYFLDVESKLAFEDAELDLLLDAGILPARAVPAFRTLMSWVVGHRYIESNLRNPNTRRPPGRMGKAQVLALDREQVPPMHADDYFAFGLDAVIAGLRVELEG